MTGPGQPFNKGRLVLILFGIAVGGVAGWLLVRSPPRPAPTSVTPTSEGPEQPIAFYLARGDAARGEAQFARCAACHTINDGGPPGVGPNLWGVLGGPVAARPGYSYSSALRTLGGRWDWETASRFVRSPREAAPGTRMAFGGVTDPQQRADLLLYLNRQGGSLAAPAGANAGAAANAAPSFNGAAPDPALTRDFLRGGWQTASCSPPAIYFSADGTTHDGRRWTLDGDRLTLSRGATSEQAVVERLGGDRIRLNTRDGPVQLTRCPLVPEIG